MHEEYFPFALSLLGGELRVLLERADERVICIADVGQILEGGGWHVDGLFLGLRKILWESCRR